MLKPVFLLSMDSDHFWAAPSTTATLKAYYLEHKDSNQTHPIELCHFRDSKDINQWFEHSFKPNAQHPDTTDCIIGFSFYTWNAAEFLALAKQIKAIAPKTLIIAGGPHVQQPEDFLFNEAIDLIFLGEAEISFTAFLDKHQSHDWLDLPGIAFLDQNQQLRKTASPERIRDLDTIPSPYKVMPLMDDNNQALYDAVSYETSRGCPFKCAFCEWGTGAIGTKMNAFSMARVREDWTLITAAKIENIWLADSNFGALKNDLEKAQLITSLKQDTGYPRTFATSWSKKHSPRVQDIVLHLNEHGLLPHYQLALQTLTPLALELSNRKNMAANKYEPIAKAMAEANVPIAAELIWGLPGDNLQDFENNLNTLLATFPNINIFAYTLLPGTEFFEKRELYKIETIPVAGYGKAKGEYVIACHTFDRDQGLDGYSMITANIIYIHGHILAMTSKLIALNNYATVSPLLRQVNRDVVSALCPEHDIDNRMDIYERRAEIYLHLLKDLDQLFGVIRQSLTRQLSHLSTAEWCAIEACIELDFLSCPRYGEASNWAYSSPYDLLAINSALSAMERPAKSLFSSADGNTFSIEVFSPGGVATVLKDPDGGSWLKSRLEPTGRSGAQVLHFAAN